MSKFLWLLTLRLCYAMLTMHTPVKVLLQESCGEVMTVVFRKQIVTSSTFEWRLCLWSHSCRGPTSHSSNSTSRDTHLCPGEGVMTPQIAKRLTLLPLILVFFCSWIFWLSLHIKLNETRNPDVEWMRISCHLIEWPKILVLWPFI